MCDCLHPMKTLLARHMRVCDQLYRRYWHASTYMCMLPLSVMCTCMWCK